MAYKDDSVSYLALYRKKFHILGKKLAIQNLALSEVQRRGEGCPKWWQCGAKAEYCG